MMVPRGPLSGEMAMTGLTTPLEPLLGCALALRLDVDRGEADRLADVDADGVGDGVNDAVGAGCADGPSALSPEPVPPDLVNAAITTPSSSATTSAAMTTIGEIAGRT